MRSALTTDEQRAVVLEYLAEAGTATPDEMAKVLQVTIGTARCLMGDMHEAGKLSRTSYRKHGREYNQYQLAANKSWLRRAWRKGVSCVTE